MRFCVVLALFMIISSAYAVDEVVFSDEELSSFADVDSSINPQKSLSENLEQSAEGKKPVIGLPDTDGTWVDELTKKTEKLPTPAIAENNNDKPILSSSDALKNIVAEKKEQTTVSQKRSNASVFDISGIMLRMNLLQAEDALKKRGFKKVSQGMQIPNFIKWRNEEKCRKSGVVGYERLESCVAKLSKSDSAQYIENAKYVKTKTSEEIELFMTSNYTNNKVYRIVYSSEIPTIKGNSPKSLYLRNIKIYEFWRKINQKYGAPDDKDEIVWGLGENKPTLKAKTGFLALEDPMLKELDWTRMSREDQKFLNTDLYTF